MGLCYAWAKNLPGRENGKLQRLEAGIWVGRVDDSMISWGMVVDEVSGAVRDQIMEGLVNDGMFVN